MNEKKSIYTEYETDLSVVYKATVISCRLEILNKQNPRNPIHVQFAQDIDSLTG